MAISVWCARNYESHGLSTDTILLKSFDTVTFSILLTFYYTIINNNFFPTSGR